MSCSDVVRLNTSSSRHQILFACFASFAANKQYFILHRKTFPSALNLKVFREPRHTHSVSYTENILSINIHQIGLETKYRNIRSATVFKLHQTKNAEGLWHTNAKHRMRIRLKVFKTHTYLIVCVREPVQPFFRIKCGRFSSKHLMNGA